MRIVYKGSFEAPQYETFDSAGFDIRTEVEVRMNPLQRVFVPTGLFIEDAGELAGIAYVRIAPRSGHAFHRGLDVLAGVVDLDYREEIKVGLINFGNESIVLKPGERIAQGILTSIFRAPGIPVKQMPRTGGFGSTNKEDA